VLRPSVVLALCIVAKRCVLEQKLLLTAYRKSYNVLYSHLQLDLCIEVPISSFSTIASHSPWNISETVRDAWLQRTTNRKWATDNLANICTVKN